MKKIIIVAVCVLFVSLLFVACIPQGDYSITVVDDDEVVVSCPEYANAGDTVKIELAALCDAYVEVTVNGEDIGEKNGDGEYIFTMPAENVVVEAVVKSAMSWEG